LAIVKPFLKNVAFPSNAPTRERLRYPVYHAS
jgi:hypothetical protein